MKIGIIGGSGLEKSDILKNIEELDVNTPYGQPSSKIKKGFYKDTEIYILSRHGFEHEITPTKVNNRANIHALKGLGCEYILATTAVGSLREEIAPKDFVILNQFIDLTRHRRITFFEDFKGGQKHTSLADPFSEKLRNFLIESCEDLNLKHHKKGTVITIEGPRFSTRAESHMFRQWGADVINMSTSPEATLAKEAEIEYAAVAMSTDYDCWKIGEEDVTHEMVMRVMEENSENVKKLIINTIEKIAENQASRKEIDFIKNSIRTIPNFPKQGIMFRDITTLFKNPEALQKTINIFYNRYKNKKIDIVTGIESRGFIIGGILAEKLGCGFVPIRKKGKLPAETLSQSYDLEYGTDTIEIHRDAISPGKNILLIDDLIATGGTAQASAQLIEQLGGRIQEIAFIIDLPDLKGKQKLTRWPVYTIISFEGE
ncbi:MAG: S-methyl-5'-thioadenosine phosphorylase [Nanoarchaeota archaeon]|nr:S-methyl-5'-thioadenosine phosphorylase [Nanoarchaeota archaeon]MBU1027455.1 S-methyl-5'-thioadenosine phosphorylase [Nanoarchaeota archaeon]